MADTKEALVAAIKDVGDKIASEKAADKGKADWMPLLEELFALKAKT